MSNGEQDQEPEPSRDELIERLKRASDHILKNTKRDGTVPWVYGVCYNCLELFSECECLEGPKLPQDNEDES